MKKIILTLVLFFLLLTNLSAQWGNRFTTDRFSHSLDLSSQSRKSLNNFELREKLNNTISKSTTDSIAEAWITHYASGLAPMGCSGNDIAIDNDGNIYVTGSIDHPEQNSNFNTIKYNSAGELLWAVQYNGPENENDGARAIALDASGYIYVTGSSSGEFTTIKYSPAGLEEWVSQYYGPVDYDDGARAIFIDSWGNIYVTGTSNGDYATIKYDQSGNEIWVARYNGPGDSYDAANDVAVDKDGNVYVCGGSMGINTVFDWAIIKYKPSGTQEWVVRYDRPGGDTGWPNALALDADGSIYVAGNIKINYDEYYTTIKIRPSGEVAWTDNYGIGSARDIAIDSYGNVYVTGVSYPNNANYLTIKYNSLGSRLWVKSYNGPGDPYGNNYDCANAILINSSGDVFVTGTSLGVESYMDYLTIKYSAAGVQQWVARYNGPGNNGDEPSGIAIDNEGNVYVTGGCGGYPIAGDCVTIRYNSSGTEDWKASYNLPGRSLENATDIVTDQYGNIYLTGNSVGFGTAYDITTIKYSPMGIQEWIVRYSGTGYSNDLAEGISIDSFGNIYITGSTSNQEYNSNDYITIKYNQHGVEQWVSKYNGPGNSYDAASDIAIDAFSNIYITGASIGIDNSIDFATIKYNPDGLQQWIKRYNGPTNGLDQPIAIEVDIDGNICITGRSEEKSIFFNGGFVTIKYDSDGNEIWANIYKGPEDSRNDPKDLKVDKFGNVFVAGISQDNFTTIKYSPSGILEWIVQYKDTSLEYFPGDANALTVDEFGNVFVTGSSYGLEGYLEYVTIKYSPDGKAEWISRYSEPGINFNIANHIISDSEGNIYITGMSGIRGFHSLIVDYLTIKYSPSGNKIWSARYSGPGNSSPSAICIDQSGNIIITGYSDDSTGGSNYLTIKYIQDPSYVLVPNEITASDYSLEQNYPNPFNPGTTIGYKIPLTQTGQVRTILKIYDILGREIETLIDEEKTVGVYEITWEAANLPSGIYFYQLKAGDFIQTKKMILLK